MPVYFKDVGLHHIASYSTAVFVSRNSVLMSTEITIWGR